MQRQQMFKALSLLLILLLFVACVPLGDAPGNDALPSVAEDGHYIKAEEVAAYLVTYERLPENYITKEEARKVGWIAEKGNLHDVAPGKSIGGDRFGNREGLLPSEKDRQYYECDINYQGGRRGAERLVYSDDGLIYYTKDHYASFTKMEGSS